LAGDDESGPIDRKVRWILSAGARDYRYTEAKRAIFLSSLQFR